MQFIHCERTNQLKLLVKLLILGSEHVVAYEKTDS